MSMSNSEKDEFIRKNLTNDKFMAGGEEVSNKIKKDIDISKIKLKKYTFGERRFMRFLGVVLIISLLSNAYLIKNKYIGVDTSNSNSEDLAQSIVVEDNVEEKKIAEDIEDVDTTNTLEDEENTTVKNVVIPKVDKTQTEDSNMPAELNEEELKKELERYSVSIGRFGEDADQLEKNTILLLIANDFFNDKVAENSGLNISANSKYAMKSENVHLYLKELTGIEIDNFLDSYVNYMKYNEKSKFYGSGPKSTDLKSEKYDISNLKIISNEDNEYVIKADLSRKSIAEFKDKAKVWKEEIEAKYSIETTIIFNKEYTYTPYLIKEFKAELKPDETDNIDRLIDVQKQEENSKKK